MLGSSSFSNLYNKYYILIETPLAKMTLIFSVHPHIFPISTFRSWTEATTPGVLVSHWHVNWHEIESML